MLLPWLAACASLPAAEPAAAHPPRDRAAWVLYGRLSITRDEERLHVGLQWHHAANGDEILLGGPLGPGVARLRRDDAGALLEMNGERLQAENWERLAAQALGESLPLSGLERWLTGDIPATRRDALGRPRLAESEGWRIEVLRYESDEADAWPALIDLRRDGLQLRLKIDRWDRG